MALTRSLLSAAAAVTALSLAIGIPVAGQQAPQQVVVKFSDPGRPGTVDISLIGGAITVRGSNRTDVAITGRPHAEGARGRTTAAPVPPGAAGLRRLPQTSGFAVEEGRNVISISSSGAGPLDQFDFEVEVPTRTTLRLATVNKGDIEIHDVDGEFELSDVNGNLTLTNVSGSVVAHTVNGTVKATMTRVTADKPMSFTSLNGAVDVTLPAAVKANVKLRSDRADVYTDFDLQTRANSQPLQDTGRDGGRFRIEVSNAIVGSVNGGGPEIEMRSFNGNIYLRKGR